MDGPPDIVWSRFPLTDPAPGGVAAPTAVAPTVIAPTAQAPEATPLPADPDLAALAPHIDAGYYRALYPDIARADIDPVEHYHRHGWRERRDPNAWFSTAYYLDRNPDIRQAGIDKVGTDQAGIDPLLHYIRHGRSEGRLPMPPGGPGRAVIDRAAPPAERPAGYAAPADAVLLDARELGNLLYAACATARGLVLSASHDRYIDVTGGLQLLIADEQGLFNGNRFAYLHVAPVLARLTLAPEAEPAMLQLVLDGRFLGLAPADVIAEALAELPPALAPARVLAVHSLFGHRAGDLRLLAAALGAATRFFWVHDYASVCAGYTLLRDDTAFCGAPPEDSMACRVCVYGDDRAAHRAALRDLFAAIGFHVLAPSRAALALWQRTADLPHLSARVHRNCLLERRAPAAPTPAPDPAAPVRVAFIGYPMAHKGWPAFQTLLERMHGDARFRFHHFASAATQRPTDGLTCIPVRASRYARHAMATALAAHGIELALILSPWPETFSYTTYEALAAGADVVTLAGSGNVADAVRRHRRGVVLRDAAALLAFFRDGRALAYAAARRAAGPAPGALRLIGGTATVDLTAQEGPDPRRLATADPALRVIAAGREIAPSRTGDRYRFDLPAQPGTIHLVSRSIVPAALLMGHTDHRRLGVAIGTMTLDGAIVPPGDPRRDTGWHAPETAWQWTSGDATLAAGDASVLELELERLVTYVASPLAPDPSTATCLPATHPQAAA